MRTSPDKIGRWKQNDLEVDLREQWVQHIGGVNESLFPRDIGFPDRYTVTSVRDMIQYIDKRRMSSNCYIQVFSDIQQEAQMWDTAYIDIDAPLDFTEDMDEDDRWHHWTSQIEDALWEVNKYTYHMEQKYNADPRVYFSGSRGFSVYIDFPRVNVPWLAVETTIKDTLSDAGVDPQFVDDSVFEKNRISRIPYTINWKNINRGLDPMFCIPIDSTWSVDNVISEAQDPEIQMEVVRSPEGNILADEISYRQSEEEFEREEIHDQSSDPDPAKALEHLRILMDLSEHINDGRHRILHFMLVPALIEAGWEDRAEIHEVSRDFIEATGETYNGTPNYRDHVDDSISRTLEGPKGQDGQWKPWSIKRFLWEYPDLLDYFDASVL